MPVPHDTMSDNELIARFAAVYVTSDVIARLTREYDAELADALDALIRESEI